jgi:3',5'-cyclic AMP phosphodiesterase CpdA
VLRTLLHLSDTHIFSSDDERLFGQDTLQNLRNVLARVDDSDIAPDAMVISGDLANNGDVAAYRRLRAVLDPWCARTGVLLIAAMGNHDVRAAFSQEMLAGGPTEYVKWIGDLRVVILDSSVPGAVHGETRPDQLEWLRAELATPAPEGSVLVFHHPPTIEPGPLVDMFRLHGADELEAVVRGSDVVAVLAGHVHHTVTGAFGGAFCYTAPAVAYTVDPLALAAGRVRGIDGSGFGLVRIADRRAVAATISC